MAIINISLDKGWQPDYLSIAMPEGGLSECKNLLPLDEYYAPFYGLSDYSSNAVTGTPLIAKEFVSEAGTKAPFIGTTTKLWRLGANKALTDVTKSATTYAGTHWSFAQYGDWLIAVNYTDAPQILKNFHSASNFVDLAGSPPKARYVLFNNGHLIFANLYESEAAYPKKLRWSAKENVELYTPSLITGADSQTLADADGEITGIATVGSGIGIFHSNSITLGVYSGAPYTYSFLANKVRNVGAIQGTIIPVENVAFFWDARDIYYFDGNNVHSIGGGVKKAVLSTLNFGYTNRIVASYDGSRGLIYWSYPTISSSDGTPNRLLIYNIRAKRFSRVDIDAPAIFNFTSGAGAHVDALDSTYPSFDAIPYYIDSPIWGGQVSSFGCIKPSNGKVATFTGDVLQGEIITPEIGGEGISTCLSVRPIMQNAVNAQVQISKRLSEAQSVSWSGISNVNPIEGVADVRATGKYLSVKLLTNEHSGLTSIKADIKETSRK